MWSYAHGTLNNPTTSVQVPTSTLTSSTEAKLPSLPDVNAYGYLVAVDARTDMAEFFLSCGLSHSQEMKSSTWLVDLRGVTFGWESAPRDMAKGQVSSVSLKQWINLARHQGWTGYLDLAEPTKWLTNGPGPTPCGAAL